MRAQPSAGLPAGRRRDRGRGLRSPRGPPADPKEVRFDGIGRYSLDATAADLRAMGFTYEGNLYDSTDCVRYAKEGEPVSLSIEPATGRVLAIKTGAPKSRRSQR